MEKERELARNTLLKIEQDENKFKVASEKIVESNTEADEELINLRFEELQRQSLGMVGTPVQPHSGKNNGSSSSNEKVASIDNNNISISSTPESISTPTTKLNRLMGTNQKDKSDNNVVQDISTPTSKLNKLMNNDNEESEVWSKMNGEELPKNEWIHLEVLLRLHNKQRNVLKDIGLIKNYKCVYLLE